MRVSPYVPTLGIEVVARSAQELERLVVAPLARHLVAQHGLSGVELCLDVDTGGRVTISQ